MIVCQKLTLVVPKAHVVFLVSVLLPLKPILTSLIRISGDSGHSGRAWNQPVMGTESRLNMWDLSTNKLNWLVVEPPLWKIWKSVGMMTFPIYGTNHLTNKCTPLQYFEVIPSAIAFAQNCMINQEVFSTACGPIQSAKPKPVGNRWLTNAKRSTRNNKARLVPEQGNKNTTFASDWVNILYLFISQWFPIHGKHELHCPSSWFLPRALAFPWPPQFRREESASRSPRWAGHYTWPWFIAFTFHSPWFQIA